MDFGNRPININISTLTLVKILFVSLMLYFLYLIKDIVIILFVALIFASAVGPWVDWMYSKKIPRALGILSIYLVLFGILGSILYFMIPPIIEQVGQLSNNFPYYWEKITSSLYLLRKYSSQYGFLDNIKTSFVGYSSNINPDGFFSTVTDVFGGIFTFFLTLVITFYMMVEDNAVKKIVWSVAPEKYQSYILSLIGRMQKKIGLWLRGQLILSLAIFVLDYIGMLVLGVNYALVLALFAGLTEFVPYIGPIIGAVPAIFLAFTQSPILALFVAILFYIVQLVENNILVPKIMQKAVGINPIISISALLIGYKLAGIVGAMLSIPVATAIMVFIKDIFDNKEAFLSEEE